MVQSKKFAIHTLGCKLNYSESSTIGRLLEENKFKKVNFTEKADVYIINTCSVTENADKECKQIIKSALRTSPEAFIAVIGCYAQLKPHEISCIEGVDLVLGASEKFKLINYLNDLHKKQMAEVYCCEIQETNLFVDTYSIGDRTRAFLKIQDGCDYNCSFCTIPLARGSSRSDTIENVLKNINSISKQGVKEIILTGVNIGDFGTKKSKDKVLKTNNTILTAKESFLDLIKEIESQQAIERIRISSIEPNLLKDEIIEFIASSKKFVPHFHIPLQSGSNKILKMMQRRYQRELYAEKVMKIKSLMPHCCIGVDVIVGFPGEKEEDFLETYHFIKQLDMSYLHVFTYSERDNTQALNIKNAVSMEIRKKRNKMLRILSTKKVRHFYEQNINRIKTVLFESENKDGQMYGFTENYVKVKTPFDPLLVNQLVQVNLSEIDVDGVMKPIFIDSAVIKNNSLIRLNSEFIIHHS